MLSIGTLLFVELFGASSWKLELRDLEIPV